MQSIKTILDELSDGHTRLETIVMRARREDRDFTVEEQREVDALTARMKTLDGKRRREDTFADLMRDISGIAQRAGHAGPVPVTWAAGSKSIGEQFVESESFRSYASLSPRTGPRAAMMPVQIMNALVAPSGGWGPGIQAPPPLPNVPAFGRVRPFQLFGRGTTNADTVPIMRSVPQTATATPTAQGATKPEMTISAPMVRQPVETIPVTTPVADQALDDVAGLRAFLDSILVSDIYDAVDNQCINGDGVSPDLLGILNVSGITAARAKGAGESIADAVFLQAMAVSVAGRQNVNAVILHPTDFGKMVTEKATGGGTYLSGQPMSGTPLSYVFGLQIALSTAIAAGTALVGAFDSAAILYERSALAIDASNSHSDFFSRNLTMLRAEWRLCLGVWRPASFGLATGL
jgi:HK97 family phage major capsid protein